MSPRSQSQVKAPAALRSAGKVTFRCTLAMFFSQQLGENNAFVIKSCFSKLT